MNDCTELQWISLSTGLFDDTKIKVISAMPEGNAIIVCWLRLLCMAGKNNDMGYVYLSREMPYSEEILSTVWGVDLPIVRLALRTFRDLRMIDIEEKGNILVKNYLKYQEPALKISERREKQRLHMAAIRASRPLLQNAPNPKDPTITAQHNTIQGEQTVSSQIDDKTTDFEKWYEAYPKKIGRGQAKRAYTTASKKTTAEVLLAGAVRVADALRRGTVERQFIPYPASWLNGERWADEEVAGTPKFVPTAKIIERERKLAFEKKAAEQKLDAAFKLTPRPVQLQAQRRANEWEKITEKKNTENEPKQIAAPIENVFGKLMGLAT